MSAGEPAPSAGADTGPSAEKRRTTPPSWSTSRNGRGDGPRARRARTARPSSASWWLNTTMPAGRRASTRRVRSSSLPRTPSTTLPAAIAGGGAVVCGKATSTGREGSEPAGTAPAIR